MSSSPGAVVAPVPDLPITSSPLSQAQALWQHFVTSPPPGTVIHPNLHLSSSPTAGLGLTVSTAIAPHTTLLSLPRTCHIRPDSNPAIAPTLPASDPFLSLCLTLLYERASPSSPAAAAHVAALPGQFDLPLAWTPGQLAHLAPTSLGLRPSIADLATDWSLHIRPYLAAQSGWPPLSPAEHTWAVCCVLSRGFRDGQGGPCLVPLLDYCNTAVASAAGGAAGPSCYIGWHEDGGVELLSGERGLVAGAEATIAYGEERGNGSLLQRYGFVVDGNQEDTCDLDVQQLATIARDMGATLHTAKRRKTAAHDDTATAAQETDDTKDGDEDEADDDDEDDGVDEFIDQLPEEFISLTIPPPYPPHATSTTSPPLPARLLKLIAALLSHYPTAELIAHSDASPVALSLPLRLTSGLPVAGAAGGVDGLGGLGGGGWVGSAELRLGVEQELDVLQLVWVALNERLAVLAGGLAGGDEEKVGQGESDEDTRRRRMAQVLQASEKRILTAHNDKVKQRMTHLLALSGDMNGDEDGESEDEEDDSEENEEEAVHSREKTAPTSKRHR